MACAKAHAGFDDIVEAVLAEAPMVPRVRVVAAAGRAVPVQCQHCEDAPCVEVCPSGALYRKADEGPVGAALEKCIGCKACILVCPFGAVQWDRNRGGLIKCDLCADIIEAGEQPRCVAACPTKARRVVDLDELVRRRQRDAARRTIEVVLSEDRSTEM